MGKLIDLTGQKFGKWTVLKRAGKNSQKQPTWLCKCVCGQKARYIKSRLCAKHYLEEYNAKHK